MTRNLIVRDSEEWAGAIITYLEAIGFPYDWRNQWVSYMASSASSLTGANYMIFNRSVPAW
jgi:hypothetical protein